MTTPTTTTRATHLSLTVDCPEALRGKAGPPHRVRLAGVAARMNAAVRGCDACVDGDRIRIEGTINVFGGQAGADRLAELFQASLKPS